MPIWEVILLGLIEGLTEFLPVSSTGHLLLTEHFLDICNPGKSFEVLIQLGAILAILSVYSVKLTRVALAMPHDARARRFVASVLLAFLPAAFIGALAHDFIKTVLFETPMLIASMLVIGGVVLLIVDRMKLSVRYTDAMDFPPSLAFKIGVMQCFAMIPGVSRSGATIVGAMLLGTDKRSAAEFSFFLAMPTMAGAFAFDLYKNSAILNTADVTNIVIGFITAFIAAVFVVKHLLDYVSRHGFALFGWWRIIVGSAAIIAMLAMGDTSGSCVVH
ncbi:undecaprenyl-diphosphate phosphatase [Hyphomicrobium sp. D-2]|uniref:undecaprenyl-diphosphate phosphatase n=1 Tax=Hyphomicrobium sp. D-2 TaxID=3041621 RepID=UPI002454F0DE|nr:undecaprenyl-diphosphate phosphatase [Hyphomicrobium sp. D-2]MDH4982598.1 undecaprenyl-diphosphate phosphatase [Hyphomicrobium sp. D-2]